MNTSYDAVLAAKTRGEYSVSLLVYAGERVGNAIKIWGEGSEQAAGALRRWSKIYRLQVANWEAA